MTSEQYQALKTINQKQADLADSWMNYWEHFSNFQTWQFWVHFFMFILPLILIFFTIDRKRAFQIGFFGFNVHVWFGYFDAFGTRQPYWSYPYQMLPFIPNSIGLDSSLVPVLFMLVYQWTLNKGKNYYLYTLLLSVGLSFILKPILVALNLFKFNQGGNYFYLFLTYFVIIFLSKWITNLFRHFQREETNPKLSN